ncbi:MAG: hypothetical protein ACE5E1_02380 [Phycisphaerae bacterium]
MDTGFLCFWLNLLIGVPQGLLDFLFGLIGQTAPQLASGIGSIFGCNL